MKKISVSLPANYTPEDPLDLKGKQPLFEAMDTQWGTLPHDQQKQAIVNAFRATMLSPRMNLKSNAILYQSIMHIPADESDPDVFENTIRDLKKRWDAQGQMGLEQQPEDVMAVDEILPGKFLPGFGGNLRRLANLGPYAEDLARIANEDIFHGGTGEIFRSGVLKLEIPGVGPKVASFAWLALAPTTSELATIDVHMMRYLGEDADSPKSDAEYLALEDRLRQERDQVYPDVPLTQYQWGVWDKQRTPGFHQDHTPLRAYDPVPYRDVNWETPVRPPRPKKPVVEAPGQMTLGKTAMTVDTIDVPTNRGDGNSDLPFIYIPEQDKVYVSTTPCSHPELMYQIFENKFNREDLLDGSGLVAGEFQPIGNRWQTAILYTDVNETNMGKIYEWAEQYKKTLAPFKKTAIIPNHLGSWVYFTDTGDFYLGYTHMTIFDQISDQNAGYLDAYRDRPMIVGQVDNKGHAEIMTDWSSLRDMAEQDASILPKVESYIRQAADTYPQDKDVTKWEMLRMDVRVRERVFHFNNGRLAKTAGELTNSFVYYNGKLVVENKPHPIIIRNHFPGIIPQNHSFPQEDIQAGLIFEENGQIYPVFHSYTVTSQERKREALAALETYYHRPIGEELDYDEAMNRLSKVSAFEPENNPKLEGFRSWIYMDGYLYIAFKNNENHQDLAEKYEIDPEDWATKPFVVGVIWPEYDYYNGDQQAVGGDINLYSDYLEELSQDTYDEDSGELEDYNERNRTEGQMLTRALIAVYEFWSDNFPGLPLSVSGRPIDEYLPPGVVKETAIGVPTEFRDGPSPIRYVTTKDGTVYTDADSPRPTHQGILVDNKIDPRDVVDAGHYEMDGTPVSLGNYEFGNGEKGSEQYKQLWGIAAVKTAMTTTFVPASSDPWHPGDGITYAYDIANDVLYWTDGHHPDIYDYITQQINDGDIVKGLPALDNFIGGFHNLKDTVDEFYEFQGSGNVRFDKVRLPDEKVMEIQAKLNEIINSGYKTSADQQLTLFDEPIQEPSGGKIVKVKTPRATHGEGSGYPFFYDRRTETLYIATGECLHMELIAAAGIELTEKDYLYGMGGDAGGTAGFLAGRVGSDWDEEPFMLFEGDESMLSPEALAYLNQVGKTRKVAATDGTVKTIPDEDGGFEWRAWVADTATRVIYASEYHGTIFNALRVTWLDAGPEVAENMHAPMGIFMPPWTFQVWYGEEYLREGEDEEIDQALQEAARTIKTTGVIELNKDNPTEDPWRGTLFVYDAKTDNLYLDYGAEYHINILSQMMDNFESHNPDDRFDFNTEYVFGAVTQSGNILFYGETDEQLPNQARARQLIEEYQQRTAKKAAVEDITVRAVDTGANHPGYDDRQPFIYFQRTKTVFIGNEGSWHANVANTVAEQFGYNIEALYESPQGIIRNGQVGFWYTEPEGEDGRPHFEITKEVEQAITQTLAGLRLTKKAEADMQGAMLGLRVPINIANAIKIDGGEPPELMHITLAYFKDKAADRDDWNQAIEIGKQWDWKLTGRILEYDTFQNDEVILWAKPEIPGLAEKREELVAALNEAGFSVDDKFDFNPHITVAYDWKGDVPELEQPIPIQFDGLYFYRGERVEKVAMSPEAITTWTVRYGPPAQNNTKYLTFATQQEADTGVEGGKARGPQYHAEVMNELHSKTASNIVRFDEGEIANSNIGFERGSRAFAYDPTTDTIYTTTGHHPDIVQELYSADMYSDEGRANLQRAANDYLGGWANGPSAHNPSKVGAWSGNVRRNKPIDDALLVKIGQTIGNSDEIPQIQDSPGGSAAGRKPVLSAIGDDPRFIRVFNDVKYNPRGEGWWKAVIQAGFNGDKALWGITDEYGSPHHAEAMDLDNLSESNGNWNGAMGGQYDKGKALTDPNTMSHVGPEPQIAQLVQEELDRKLKRDFVFSAVIENDEDRLHSGKFSYNPETDEFLAWLVNSKGFPYHYETMEEAGGDMNNLETIVTGRGDDKDLGYRDYTPFGATQEAYDRAVELAQQWQNENYPPSATVYDPRDSILERTEQPKIEQPQIEPPKRKRNGLDKVLRTSALIAQHIDEVYPLTSQNYIFLYNPEDDMLYIGTSRKFHIDLINYVIGQVKHTNPDDSYQMLDKYVLGVMYHTDGEPAPEFHTAVDPQYEARINELDREIMQVMGGY